MAERENVIILMRLWSLSNWFASITSEDTGLEGNPVMEQVEAKSNNYLRKVMSQLEEPGLGRLSGRLARAGSGTR